MDLLALSRDLIAADTVSHKGTSAAVAILRPLYEAAGFAVAVQEVREGDALHQNLLGTYQGADARGLLLVTHLDTVDAGPPELWTETGAKPHVLTRKGDVLYGLGSADTKLDALCKLFAARDFKGRPLARSLQLLGTFAEEVGCKGARHFADSDLFQARFVACSEPSELRLIRAHKGYAVVDIELSMNAAGKLAGPFSRAVFHGKAAHSSTPALGENAIAKALGQIAQRPLASLDAGTVVNKVPARCEAVLAERRGDGADPSLVGPMEDGSATLDLAQKLFDLWSQKVLALEPTSNPAFAPDTCVVNWGICRLSGRRASLSFDARLLPGHDPYALTRGFGDEAAALAQRSGGQLSVHVGRANPAMELPDPSPLLAAAQAACADVGLPTQAQAKPTNTEAGVFASRGVEAFVFGPGRSTGNAHCANEHNQLSQLEKAIEFYRALISRVCTF